MLTKAQIALIIVALVIVILFAFTYFVLFKMAFTARVKLINFGFQDDKIKEIVTKKYQKYIKKNPTDDFVKAYTAPKKTNVVANRVIDLIVMTVALISVALISVGIYFRINEQQIFINNKTLLVIETNSMETVHPDNEWYIEANNLNNQINARSLVQIIKTNDYTKFDICAFNSKGRIIVHRIIEDPFVENGKVYYTFRGDANPLSLAEEIKVSHDQIIGEVTGFSSEFLGTSIMFLQSGIGMITILVSLIIYALYSKFYDYEDNAFNERCRTYVLIKYQEILDFREKARNEIIDQTDEQIITVTIQNDNFIDFAKIKTTSYFEKIVENAESIKAYYNELKSHLMSYGLSNRVSKNYETFKYKNDKLFLLEIRGKTLKLNINYLHENLEQRYHAKENTKNKYKDYNSFIKLTSQRSLKYAKEIIDLVLKDYNLNYKYEFKDYLSLLQIDSDKGSMKIYSMFAKISLADDMLREQYNIIKNKILSYKGTKNRLSKHYETFNYKGEKIFLIEFRGNHIKLNLNKELKEFAEKYHLKGNTGKKVLNYPCHLKVQSNRSLKYALEIIESILKDYNLEIVEEYKDYLVDIPKEDISKLVANGEIIIKTRK